MQKKQEEGGALARPGIVIGEVRPAVACGESGAGGDFVAQDGREEK